MSELSKQFRFEAAHTLHRSVDAEPSRRIHGHSYRAEVTITGTPDPDTGMILDLGRLEETLDAVRDALDHRFLNEVDGLGPPTLENLCAWIGRRLCGLQGLCAVAVHRDSTGDSCRALLEQEGAA